MDLARALAFAHTRTVGTLATIRANGRPQLSNILYLVEGDAITISVTDTGVGISRENLARIMEPLYTTKARGLGLGLAIARSILDKNRGTLQVVSEPGKGSTFTVKLPAVVNREGECAR